MPAQPQVIQGAAIGTGLSVFDSTALAALSTQGVNVGTQVYNTSVGAWFALTVSTASLVTDSVVAVNNITGLRWIKQNSIPSLPLGPGALSATLFKSYCSLGADASVTPTHITATGVKVGDSVIMVADVTDHVSQSAAFESTVTVADQIQQLTDDLSAKTLVILVLAQS